MERLAGVLLQVGPRHADGLDRPVVQDDLDLALAHDGQLVLADLVALGEIRVEVILPGEDRALSDMGRDRTAEAHGKDHRLAVEHRQDTGQPQVNGAGLGIGFGPEGGRCPGEDLGLSSKLGVDLQPDDGFPLHDSLPGGRWMRPKT